MDANVYDLMAKEEMPPPPPYTSNSGGKRNSSSFRLTVPNSTSDRINEKRKSEIRSLLEATEARGDDHKPEWMYSHDHPPADISHRHPHGGSGLDNGGYETEDEGESKALPWHREDEAVLQQQQHFPAWIKDVHPASPHSTLLGRSAASHRDSKRDSLTSFLGEEGWDHRSGPRRNSKDSDFLSVLANPVNIRRSSAPPVQTRQRSLSSIKLRPEDDEESEHNLTPILERKSGRQPFTKKDTVLQLELQFETEMRKPHYY
jgi:hypothetical protein